MILNLNSKPLKPETRNPKPPKPETLKCFHSMGYDDVITCDDIKRYNCNYITCHRIRCYNCIRQHDGYTHILPPSPSIFLRLPPSLFQMLQYEDTSNEKDPTIGSDAAPLL